MSDLLHDARHALRGLARTPGFTAVAVLTLALGIGATTAIYSAVDALLLRSLPYPQPEQLVMVWSDGTKRGYPQADVVNPGIVREWDRSLTAIDQLAGFNPWGPTLAGGDDGARRATGAMVSAAYFATLGVEPALGRGFSAEEDVENGARVIVVTDGFWKRELGGDPVAVGKAVTLNGEPWTVVGVLPAGFRAPLLPGVELFRPLQGSAELSGGFWLAVLGRLAPGATIAQADAELDAVQARLAAQEDDLRLLSGFVQPLHEVVVADVRDQLLLLLGATAAVLLMACANLANLLLTRATGRSRELAVRAALGAGRGRLVAQLLTESAVLALIGAAVGLVVARLGIAWVQSALPPGLLEGVALGLDLPVLAFALAAAIGAGLISGGAPALAAARQDLVARLRDSDRAATGGRAAQRLRATLVVGTFALALALTVGAGLFLKSLLALQQVDPGFEPQGLLSFSISLPAARYADDDAVRAGLAAFDARLAAVPGVVAAGATSILPFSGSSSDTGTIVDGTPVTAEPLRTWFSTVTPGFFGALGVPVLQGRALTAADTREGGACTIVVNRALVAHHLGGADALGKRLLLNPRDAEPTPCEIVGVVGDFRSDSLAAPPKPSMYFSSARSAMRRAYVLLRTPGDPQALLPAVKRAVAEVDPGVALGQVATMGSRMHDSLRTPRLVASLTAAFAALALLLATLGVYGVIAHGVAARTREFGVRMALGAAPGTVLREVLASGLKLALLGVAFGALLAFAFGRGLAALLFQVDPFDPLVLAGVSALLLAVAAAATLLPAWRAARVDPVVALHYE
jgi:putative ABC transport system permease protein